MDELRKTAIHEAGHAVAFVRLFPDCVPDSVSVEPDGDTLGSHIGEELTLSFATSDADAERYFEARAIYSCAGYAAVTAAGYPDDETAEGCGPDFEESGHRLEVGKRKAIELMQRPENVRAVQRVADELMARQRLAGDHVNVLVDVADGETTEAEYQEFLQLCGL